MMASWRSIGNLCIMVISQIHMLLYNIHSIYIYIYDPDEQTTLLHQHIIITVVLLIENRWQMRKLWWLENYRICQWMMWFSCWHIVANWTKYAYDFRVACFTNYLRKIVTKNWKVRTPSVKSKNKVFFLSKIIAHLKKRIIIRYKMVNITITPPLCSDVCITLCYYFCRANH